ncbi:MAG: oligosaccharide repeat unit polymerase [Candidatus Phocaeicola faecigallinarum]|uniref:Oligosaccharide repeat unit polymerase n=1 Tax=Candidatus Phocaeicola faecigallinarum TaxID=2838732 RepID=A0A948T9Q1_9BACT|nr:oligosaccharide repeat unit polymerase [Candidatus Phocaeicola faecigallinarum]
MLLAIPVFHFLFLLIYIIRKNGFDISAGMATLYLITSLAGLILGNLDMDFNYENYSRIEIELLPIIVYCLCITICIYPFILYNSNKKRELLQIKNIDFFSKIVYFYFFVFIFLIVLFFDQLIFMFLYGDLGELRTMAYAGELSTVIDSLSGFPRRIAGIMTIFGDGANMMIPFFFYSFTRLNKSVKFNFLILISSLSPVLLGIVNVDRSKTTFWILLFFMSFLFFKQYIVTKKQKRIIKIFCLVFGGALLLYLAAVTISRWDDTDQGVLYNVLCYLGQPVINFCNIWSNLPDNQFYIHRIFPFYSLIGDEYDKFNEFIINGYLKNGVHLNVFFSFVGMFLVDMGHYAAVIISIIIALLELSVLRKTRLKRSVSMKDVVIVFALGSIVQCGIITYFYGSIPRILAVFIFLILSKYLKKRSIN